MPLGFSYRRWSSEQQADGDSRRRQTAGAEAWCKRNGVQLDTSLNMTDAGVPAFRGGNMANPDVHALAGFFRAVEQGRVPRGSYLIVESFDRISRQEARLALPPIFSLINAGIKIVQLIPELVLDDKSDEVTIILLVVTLARGHNESLVKSARVGEAWQKKREQAATTPLTRKVPGWIKYGDNGLSLIPDRAATVRRLFAEITSGYGIHAISKRLNADGVPTFGRSTRWTENIVHHILTSRAVIGEFQPHRGLRANARKGRAETREPIGPPIPNYFPAVVTADEFYAASHALKSRTKGGRPTGASRSRHVNLFAGLLHDARDGGSLTYKHHKTLPPVVIPVGAKTGAGTPWTSFPARPLEAAVLTALRELKPSDVLPGGKGPDRVAALSARLTEAEKKVRFYKEKCEQSEEAAAVFADVAVAWERTRREVASELAEAQREAASPVSEAWGEFQSLAGVAATGTDEDRVRLRAALRRVIDGIWVLFDRADGVDRLAAVQVWFVGGTRFRVMHIRVSPPRGNQKVRTPGQWWVTSFRHRPLPASGGVPGTVDLRNPEGAAKVLKVLATYDPEGRPEDYPENTATGTYS